MLISRLPKKGLLKDALNGEKNLISLAFECRGMENKVLKQLQEEHSTLSASDDVSDETDETIIDNEYRVDVGLSKNSNEYISASSLLENNDWLSNVQKCLDPLEKLSRREINNECKRQADILKKVLIQRLDSHISSRIIDKSKHSHWCLEWARKNIPQMSAIMTLFNHTKKISNVLIVAIHYYPNHLIFYWQQTAKQNCKVLIYIMIQMMKYGLEVEKYLIETSLSDTMNIRNLQLH